MKILVCGEGDHDSGANRCSGRARDYRDLDGWIQVILRKFIPEHGDISFVVLRRSQLISLPRSGHMRRMPKWHGKKALYAMEAATAEECDLVVFMVDADSNSDKEWRRKRQEILDGFREAGCPVPGVACVPMSASESWLLSDRTAWVAVGLPANSSLPANPERIWGNRNSPGSNHPHQYFRRTCQAAERADDRQTRCEIAENSDLVVLVAKCPNSFVAFRNDLTANLQP